MNETMKTPEDVSFAQWQLLGWMGLTVGNIAQALARIEGGFK